VFVVSQDLGVGFTSLLDHMSESLHLLDRGRAASLGKIRLPKIREDLCSVTVEHDLVPVGARWGARPVDLEVGDVALLPDGARFAGSCASLADRLLLATTAGIGELSVPGRATAISVRVSRRPFVGRAVYRHLEEADDE
jgi:hypothetical protein